MDEMQPEKHRNGKKGGGVGQSDVTFPNGITDHCWLLVHFRSLSL